MNKDIDKEIHKVYEKHQDLIDSLPEEDKEAILGYIFFLFPKLMESTCVEPSIEKAYANYRKILDSLSGKEQEIICSDSTRQDSKIKSMEKNKSKKQVSNLLFVWKLFYTIL